MLFQVHIIGISVVILGLKLKPDISTSLFTIQISFRILRTKQNRLTLWINELYYTLPPSCFACQEQRKGVECAINNDQWAETGKSKMPNAEE
jgi:hypothetical protein